MENDGLDEDGFIRNSGSLDKIPERFTAVLKFVQNAVESQFGQEMHSLYVYGSVASGKARPKLSDLDVFIVFKNDVSPQNKESVVQLEKKLSHKFLSEVREVGIACASVPEIFEGDNQVGWGCFIKHMCVCLSGENLATALPKFEPTRAVAFGLNGDLKQEMEKVRTAMSERSDATINKTVMSFSRKMVRTAFGLVIEEAHCWTTDLNECATIFESYYPEHVTQIRQTLEIAKGAPVDCDKFLILLDGFGCWLAEEIDRKLLPFASQNII